MMFPWPESSSDCLLDLVKSAVEIEGCGLSPPPKVYPAPDLHTARNLAILSGLSEGIEGVDNTMRLRLHRGPARDGMVKLITSRGEYHQLFTLPPNNYGLQADVLPGPLISLILTAYRSNPYRCRVF
ncbi:hypothetical protein RRG08_020497 [Elysia crispata]|uniref:Uncharacterized protein n=1 Tax=Elysia crispata TaxID=231223 RepID=A0AAE1DFQ5_9GAST|nr:hypothetical protein RRG08_020497 [Elysia crispata]